MKRSFHYLLFFMLFLSFTEVKADPVIRKSTPGVTTGKKKAKKKPTIYKGADYNVATKKRASFNYTRNFSTSGKNLFLTTYTVYDASGTAIRNIVAIHNKKSKMVEVTVKDLEHSGFPVMNVERTQYSAPFMGRFGSTGKVGLMGNTKAGVIGPGQLTVKFVSRKFDYIKVVHISGPHEDARKNLQVYVLDES
jgi:hypothetical protein